jgi:hypothetical protein
MRLAHICTQDAANAFLPAVQERFNARFAQPPTDPTPAWVPLPPHLDLAYYFAARESRTVRADHCVQWNGKVLQIAVDPQTPNLARRVVSVHVVPEGDLYLYHDRQRLLYHEIPVRATPRLRTDGQHRWLFGHRQGAKK